LWTVAFSEHCLITHLFCQQMLEWLRTHTLFSWLTFQPVSVMRSWLNLITKATLFSSETYSLPLFYLCIHHTSLLLFFSLAVSPVVLLFSECVTFCALFICQGKIMRCTLSDYRELVIIDWSNALHSPSLVKYRIHICNSTIQDRKSQIELYKKYVWQFVTTSFAFNDLCIYSYALTILHLMTYGTNA